MNLFKHIVEFRRRKVFRALITYLVIAWLIAQVSSIVLPIYNVPDNFMKIIISILIIGCPICLVLTWLYDKSPSRIKKNEFVDTYKLNIKKKRDI